MYLIVEGGGSFVVTPDAGLFVAVALLVLVIVGGMVTATKGRLGFCASACCSAA